MTALSRTPAASTDRLLAELIEEFLAELEAGGPITPTGFAARHPEQAAALSHLLPALEALADLGRSAGSSGPRSDSGLDREFGPGRLGDYQILREVGRGGMGIVYEAEQISLRRRVALKVLPFAAAIGARQLQRFQLEAQAAAYLHHQHIVPVFAFGCERGVHYYAMQYIDGRSLADVIRELRQLEGLEEQARSGPIRRRLDSHSTLLPEGSLPHVRQGRSPARPPLAWPTHPALRWTGLARLLRIPRPSRRPLGGRPRRHRNRRREAGLIASQWPGWACRRPRPSSTPISRGSSTATSSRPI
jgi:hypothetical protein